MARCITIGKLAKISGVSTRTIRHYEEIGLLPCADKTGTGYRLYGDAEVHRLEKILLFKSLGFSLEEIQTILAAEENQMVVGLFQNRMQVLEREMSELSRYKEMLKAITRIYQLHGLEYVNNYHLMKEMVGMNNLFVKAFNQLELNLQIKILREIYRTGTLAPETLKEVGIEPGSHLLNELHMIIVKVLLNKVDHAVEREIVLSLEKTDPEFAAELKKAMFTFEDIVILSDVIIAKWLEKCTDEELVIAFSESGKYVRNRILQIMSAERAARIRTSLKEAERPTLDEVYVAMTHLVDLLRKMEADGEIRIERFE